MPKPSSTKKMLTPVDQLIKKSWQEYCQRFTELIPLALLPLFGMLFCSFSLAIILVDVYTGWFKLPWALALSGGLALLLFVVGVWLNLAGPVGVYAALARKNKLALWPSFIEGGHYVGRWLMLSLAVAVMLLAWFMALVVPFFIFVIFYAMANWALFFEGYEGFSALKRSRELVKDYWFAVTGRILLMMLVAMIAGGIVNIIIFMIISIHKKN